MSQQPRFQGFPGDECICGRRATIRHCPECGSVILYPYAKPEHFTNRRGEMIITDRLFRCRACGKKFVDEDRDFCDAPPTNLVLAKLKVQRLNEARARGHYLTPQEEKIAGIVAKIKAPKSEASNGNESTEAQTEPKSEVEALAEGSSNPKDINFIPPNGLTRPEYDVADRAFRLEWAHKKLAGQDTGISVEEYVERRLKGELFQ